MMYAPRKAEGATYGAFFLFGECTIHGSGFGVGSFASRARSYGGCWAPGMGAVALPFRE